MSPPANKQAEPGLDYLKCMPASDIRPPALNVDWGRRKASWSQPESSRGHGR